jgi:predicted secreted protein
MKLSSEMSPLAILLIYSLSWWVVLFTVLPLGIQPQAHDRFGASAPARTYLKKKILATTLLAAVVTAVIATVIIYEWIPVQ